MNIENEWNLFLLVQKQIDAGQPQVSFNILGPALWTMFSGLPARLRSAEGNVYEVGPTFTEVLHELARFKIRTSLTNAPGEYRLYFRPAITHPRYDPAAEGDDAPLPSGVQRISSSSPEALRGFLELLPPDSPLRDDPDDRQ